jgi:transitional endoplasmic reticulum ATPase
MSYLGTNKEAIKKVHEALEALSEATAGVETVASGIRDHEQTFYVKPEARSYAQMAEIAVAAANEEKQTISLSRTFKYLPWDGAYATAKTLSELFGYPGFGKASMSMFGSTPPQRISIQVSANETIEVPWGQLEVPDLKAVLTLGGYRDKDYGQIFNIEATIPKSMEKTIKGLFNAIEITLQNDSIYKGKAFTGADMPEFIDPFSITKDKVIYTRPVEHQLTGLLWNPIRFTERARERGISLKRCVLLAGPYGTGKSLTGMLTAQEAVNNGWTYILCRPGKDDLDVVMQRAKLYQPAVVFYEDIDVLASSTEKSAIQSLLDVFDGITAKGTEIQVVMTTNHLQEIHKGMLRPGRMDGIVKIDGLDSDGCARMVMAMSGQRLAGDLDALKSQFSTDIPDYGPEQSSNEIDLATVGKALESYEPAFVAEAIKRADLFNLDKENVTLTTEDFVWSSESLRFQWEQYNGAGEHRPSPEIDTSIASIVSRQITEVINNSYVDGNRIEVDN